MRHTFFGGVCPAPHKETTRRKAITELSAPRRVTLPLRASADGPCKPLVKPGQQVYLGQPVACSVGSQIPLHASVSGRVVDINGCPHPWGGEFPAIILENDGRDTPWPQGLPPLKADEIQASVLLDRVREAGIVGMGGGAFPTVDKLAQAVGRTTFLIINAAECEPYVSADHRLLLEHCDQILISARVMARCLRIPRVVLVTEGDKLNAAEQLERRIRKHRDKVELYTLRTRYPLGAEKQIVQTVTGQELPQGHTAQDAGCLVLNLATVYAIYEALFLGRPLTHRAVTVTGGGVLRPKNLWVPIGTPLRHLLEEAEGLREGCTQLLTGGVMMGKGVSDLDAPVLKDTNSLIALGDDERKDASAPETTCIRCGKCVAACPMHLAPTFVNKAIKTRDEAWLKKLHPQDCISCGCCSFVCPSNIHLTWLMEDAKKIMEEEGGHIK